MKAEEGDDGSGCQGDQPGQKSGSPSPSPEITSSHEYVEEDADILSDEDEEDEIIRPTDDMDIASSRTSHHVNRWLVETNQV